MSFTTLLENLFEDDLKNMVEPVVSVDDFESKIDDQTLVIAFYVKNDSAAEDLSVFLERSRFEYVMDTEVSQTTNKDGDFLVFVEMDAKEKSIDQISTQTLEITRIASILVGKNTKWRLKNNRVLGTKTVPLTENNIKVLLNKIKDL